MREKRNIKNPVLDYIRCKQLSCYDHVQIMNEDRQHQEKGGERKASTWKKPGDRNNFNTHKTCWKCCYNNVRPTGQKQPTISYV